VKRIEQHLVRMQAVTWGGRLRVVLVLGSLAGMVLAAGAGSQWFSPDGWFWW
jgi:hypothetical protein